MLQITVPGLYSCIPIPCLLQERCSRAAHLCSNYTILSIMSNQNTLSTISSKTFRTPFQHVLIQNVLKLVNDVDAHLKNGAQQVFKDVQLTLFFRLWCWVIISRIRITGVAEPTAFGLFIYTKIWRFFSIKSGMQPRKPCITNCIHL